MPSFTHLFRTSNFAPAFLFLPADRQHALRNLYAVFRVLDDAVDQGHPEAKKILTAWQEFVRQKDPQLVAPFGHQELAQGLLVGVKEYGIELFPVSDMISKGLEVDLAEGRFQTPMDLESYCYGVAGTVGLSCLPIFGVPLQEAKDFAIRLGTAVQWINIIRDVGQDAGRGRIYLPLDHLEQFGYTEKDLFEKKDNKAFHDLLLYEAQVARSHYKRAMDLIPPQWFDQLLPARIMGHIYLALLKKIERKGFPVLLTQVRLTLLDKLQATFRAWREKHDQNILENTL